MPSNQSPGIRELQQDQAKQFALYLIRAKFGKIPESLTLQECVELMLRFTEVETARADAAVKMAQDYMALQPNPPFIIERKS